MTNSNVEVKTTISEHILQVVNKIDHESMCYYPTTSLHVLPRDHQSVNDWLQKEMSDAVCRSYIDGNGNIQIITFMSFVHRFREAPLTMIIADDKVESSVINQAIQESTKLAFYNESMQRITIYVREGDEQSVNSLKGQGFEKECVFGEAYWYKGRFVDLEVYGKLKLE